MKIHCLDWDTALFGMKVGKIEIYEESLFDTSKFIKQAFEEQYELIYVIKFNSILPNEKANTAHIDLVDIMLTLSKELDYKNYVDIRYKIYNELTQIELAECYRIAEQTSVMSRFYKERKVGPDLTKKLYRKWIDNTINQTFSDGLFLNKESDAVNGIHLIKTDVNKKLGYFSLTGVDAAYRGKGIGKSLWKQSFAYLVNTMDVQVIRSSFSLNNIGSFNFHLNMGFRKVEEIKYIYHYRNTYLK